MRKSILIFCGVSAFLCLPLFTIAQARLAEFEFLLSGGGSNTFQTNSAVLVIRLKEALRRASIGELDSDIGDELKLMISFGSQIKQEENAWHAASIRVGMLFLNAVNFLTGSPVVETRAKSTASDYLKTAYLLELQKRYSDAVLAYESMLEFKSVRPELRYYAKLHKGFCHAATENSELAIKDFSEVAAQNLYPELAEVARRLLGLIRSLDNLRAMRKTKLTALEQAIQHFRFGEYSKSLRIFQKLNNPETAYYLARNYEELGRSQEALAIYQMILESGSANIEKMKEANRRIYVIATLYEKNPEVARAAKERSIKRLADGPFFQKVESIENEFQTARTSPAKTRSADLTASHSVGKDRRGDAAAKGEKCKILTKEGGVYIGEISSESGTELILKTNLGNISLKKTEIIARHKFQ